MKTLYKIIPAILFFAIALTFNVADADVIKGVVIEGDSMFNGTTSPQNKPYKKPYTEEELKKVKFSAERGSKLFILTEDGTLYYPVPKKGDLPSINTSAPRITRVFGKAVDTKGLFKWLTLVHVVGLEVELTGEEYPGVGSVKAFHIETIKCDNAESNFQ